MPNAIEDGRKELHAMLTDRLAGVLEAERVHLYTPTLIASPCVWIAQPSVVTQNLGSNGAKARVVTFPIFMVPDGYEPEQCRLLDEIVARVSDAIYDLPRTADGGASPQPVDIGGSTIRGVVQDADMTVMGHSFCQSQ